MPPTFHLGDSPVLDRTVTEPQPGPVWTEAGTPAESALCSFGQRLAFWAGEAIAFLAPRFSGARHLSRRARPDCDTQNFQHVEEIQLLGYLDGELSRDMRHRVTRHFQVCWSCRGRLRELRNHIEAFLSERESCMPGVATETEQRIWELRQRLSKRQEAHSSDGER